MMMSWKGYAWLFPGTCSINSQQLLQILQPYQGQFPSTNSEIIAMQFIFRRMGRTLENPNGNIAQQVRAAREVVTPSSRLKPNCSHVTTHGNSLGPDIFSNISTSWMRASPIRRRRGQVLSNPLPLTILRTLPSFLNHHKTTWQTNRYRNPNKRRY